MISARPLAFLLLLLLLDFPERTGAFRSHAGARPRRTRRGSSPAPGDDDRIIAPPPLPLKSKGGRSDSQLRTEEKVSKEIADLMAEHDPILLFASRLLPAATARDASALYAWCRRLDELTDDAASDVTTVRTRLAEWEERFDALCDGRPVDEMDAALARCLRRHEGSSSLTQRPFRDMMAGMTSDAVEGVRTVETMDELETYAYRVAGTVGLMLLPLLGADDDAEDDGGAARAPAVALGKAIQLINVLRDAAPDAALGRVYLPRDMLAREGVTEREVLALQSSEGYRAVVREVAHRAAELLGEAEAGRSTLPGLGPLFVQIVVELYRGYLTKLEEMGYDNMNAAGDRVKIGTLRKAVATCKAIYACLPVPL